MPQKSLVLRNCGLIDPQDVDSYLAQGGFEALRRVQSGMTPAQVMEHGDEPAGYAFPEGPVVNCPEPLFRVVNARDSEPVPGKKK
mgnify:CR=1 FL=1